MPYQDSRGRMQRSSSLGHVPLANSEIIRSKLDQFRTMADGVSLPLDQNLLISADSLGPPDPTPTWVMSFDGSDQEVAAREDYPSTRLGYLQVAGVLVNLTTMLGQGNFGFVDPAVIKTSATEALHSIVMPSSNVCRPDMLTVRDSWRAEVFEVFRDYTVEDVPLLDTFLLLAGERSATSNCVGIVLGKCSADPFCSNRSVFVPRQGLDCSICGGQLFPTDALRIHEEVSEYGSNLSPLGRLMSVLEHITMVAYINFLWNRRPQVFGNVAFVLDGPLAVFGPQAWLHNQIFNYIQNIYSGAQSQGIRPPGIVGVEKTGQFADHAAAITNLVAPRTLMCLPDDYIYGRILASQERPGTTYGRDEYYGRKFFYKTAQGKMLTISVPPTVDPASPGAVDPSMHPALANTLNLLDKIGTSLYEDALIPVALAHAYASIPLRTGSKVLALLSQEMLGN